ncbi:hypothetical protein D3C74_340170 [compost metagenome]
MLSTASRQPSIRSQASSENTCLPSVGRCARWSTGPRPVPTANAPPARSAPVNQVFASRVALSQPSRRGRRAATAADSEHPVPWVCTVSTRGAEKVVTSSGPRAPTRASGDSSPVR